MAIKLMGSKAEEKGGGLLQQNNRHASAVSSMWNSKTHNSMALVALKTEHW